MIDTYYNPLELVLLIMSMAFCVFFGIILGYKIRGYEKKDDNNTKLAEFHTLKMAQYNLQQHHENKKKKRFLPLLKRNKKKEADNNDGIKLPKNMEW